MENLLIHVGLFLATALAYASRFLKGIEPVWQRLQARFPRVPMWAYPLSLIVLEQGVAATQGLATPESLAAACVAAAFLVLPGGDPGKKTASEEATAAVARVKELSAKAPPGGLPPAAALLLLSVMSYFGLTACTATLEESRPKVVGISVAGLTLLEPGSPECLGLSRKRDLWRGLQVGLGSGGLASTAGLILEEIRQEGDVSKAEAAALLAVGGAFAATALFAGVQADGYSNDFVASGCGSAPASK
jgi:hypothetical protein